MKVKITIWLNHLIHRDKCIRDSKWHCGYLMCTTCNRVIGYQEHYLDDYTIKVHINKPYKKFVSNDELEDLMEKGRTI